MTDLFSPDPAGRSGVDLPLAVRMRPISLDEIVGQQHLLKTGSPLRRLASEPAARSSDGADSSGGPGAGPGDEPGGGVGPASVILWGPPGSGKTTLAHVISRTGSRRFVELSAITAGVKDVRAVMEAARTDRDLHRRQTVLFLDEIHRFTKAQQDALLPGVENRWVILVAATTENPSFSVIAPLLSRSLVLTLRELDDADIRELLLRAVADPRGLGGAVTLDGEALDHLVRLAGGDARRALTALEAAAGATLESPGPTSAGSAPGQGGSGEGGSGEGGSGEGGSAAAGPAVITLAAAERAIDAAVVRYDKEGDQHYDVISAFIKSLRGSDVDAAMHYLARMIEAGEDPRFIARRLVISAAEDVGLADPTALQTAVAAAQAVQLIGMPEGRIVLAEAVAHIALAPKSNASYLALEQALADVRGGLGGPVPKHLRDSHYPGAKRLGHGRGYRYAHDDPRGVVEQQYAPDDVTERRYYHPTERGLERELAERWARLRAALGRD